jgi:hypothetical protein
MRVLRDPGARGAQTGPEPLPCFRCRANLRGADRIVLVRRVESEYTHGAQCAPSDVVYRDPHCPGCAP